MKRFFLMSVLLASVFTFKTADAQVSLNVNVNLGSQPSWGPAGYNYVEYYYLPDINTYYHVNSRKYTYYNGKKWLTVGNMPRQYRHHNLYNVRKVVINRAKPWQSHNYYVTNYSKYKGHKSQPTIRDHKRNNNYKPKHNGYKRDGGEGHRHHSSRR